MPVRHIRAGGAVVTRDDQARGPEVVLVHRSEYDDWTLPKGKVHGQEPVVAAAVREVAEETGVHIRLGVPLDSVCYATAKGPKRVDYWSGTALRLGTATAGSDEIDEVSWLPVRTAMSRLTYAHDHHLLQQHCEQPATVPLILLRHGKAVDRKDWSKKDLARPVADLGARQARLLVPMLAAYGVGTLVSSTAARCVDTLVPYGKAQRLPIEKYHRLTEEEGRARPSSVAALVRSVRDRALHTHIPIAICLHRPVLPQILAALDLAPLSLRTGEFLVAHLTLTGEVHAVERHRPDS